MKPVYPVSTLAQVNLYWKYFVQETSKNIVSICVVDQ